MNDIDVNNFPIGVFIGRLQVHELHEGHHYVIQQVVENHKKTIIFLGVPQFIGTKKNPLDFDTRKKMVQSEYPNSVIIALPDNRDNQKWAHEIDKRIREVYPHGDVLLYGSRDSFIPYYIDNGGKFQTKELQPLGTFTGTDIRKTISEDVKNSPDFRAGVIYHAYNLFPRVVPIVNIAIIDNNRVLLGKKIDDNNLRFIGGFILTSDKSIKESINRIILKETNSIPTDINYIDSIQINDWRFKGEDDKVMCNFYNCKLDSNNIQPSDDIIELKWENIDNELVNIVVDEHKQLVEILLNKININNG